MLKTLVENGISPHIVDYGGRSLLHLASSNGNVHAVEYLLSHGVSAVRKDSYGSLALDAAMLEGHFGVQELLWAALQQGPQSSSPSFLLSPPVAAQPACKRTLDAGIASAASKRLHGDARPPLEVQAGPDLWLAAADVRCADAGATAATTNWGRTLSAPARCETSGGKGGADSDEPLLPGKAPSELL